MIDTPPEVKLVPELDSDRSAEAFLSIADRLSDERYWQLLRWVWIKHGGSISRLKAQEKLLLCPRPKREFLMLPEESAAFAALADEVEAFHGTSMNAKEFGWSWALKFHSSYSFASKRYADGPKVMRGLCKKQDIIAYFPSYDENEIVINPVNASVIEELVKDALFEARNKYKFD